MLRIKKIALLALLPFFSFSFSACTNILGPQKAGLQVMSADIPASVFIDDQYLDKTPFKNTNLKAGEYLIKIQPDDPTYVAYESKISLKKGLLTVVTWKPGTRPELGGGVIYEMEKSDTKNVSQLSLISIPDRAIVSIDGKEKDFAPFLIEEISPGHHEFEVSLPSYETQKHTINVIDGYRMLVTVKLAKQNYSEKTTIQDDDSKEATQSTQASESASASPSAKIKKTITGDKVIINKTGFLVESKEVLRVRDNAGSGKEIGFANVGEAYAYLDETKAGWYKIDFNGETGWVSGQYATLVTE